MRMYLVGGFVRDEILGVPSKDVDYSVVLDPSEVVMPTNGIELSPFLVMEKNLEDMGFKIFLRTPEYLTIRAQVPKNEFTSYKDRDGWHPIQGYEHAGLTADFVLARKESNYTDGRRPDVVEVGTLEADLRRRDFSMNAIAKDRDGSYIDPFNGREDIANRIIRAVGDPFERLREDALRAVRALRFSVTKNFQIESSLAFAMETAAVLDSIVNNISDERIQIELSKMFRFDTVASLRVLEEFPLLTTAIFGGSVSLDATMKTRGRRRS